MLEPRCNVCKRAEARALVDGALTSGETPHSTWKMYGEALGLGQSSVYRHARLHLNRSLLQPQFVGGEATMGEVVADLSALRVSLHQRYMDAAAQGHDAAADRAAREAVRIAEILLKAGVPDDNEATALARVEVLTKAIQRATTNRPAFAIELAEAARARGDGALADDAEKLAQVAIARQESKIKSQGETHE